VTRKLECCAIKKTSDYTASPTGEYLWLYRIGNYSIIYLYAVAALTFINFNHHWCKQNII